MIFEIVTLFPGMFDGAFSDSIINRAVQRGVVSIHLRDLREFSRDERHATVDDYLYGGEPGMLLKPEPLADAIRSSRERLAPHRPMVVFMTPQGEPLTQGVVNELLAQEALVIVCGRYKGIDQRIRDALVDRELSVGDYVLSGGEIPAMVLVDALTRLLPGALGDRESAENDSFYRGLLSAPHYTRPEEFEGMRVPPVLLSGNHGEIDRWRFQQACETTRRRRPDVWSRWCKENSSGSTTGKP